MEHRNIIIIIIKWTFI